MSSRGLDVVGTTAAAWDLGAGGGRKTENPADTQGLPDRDSSPWDSGDGFFTTAFLGGGGRKTENPATWVGLAFGGSISGRVEVSG